MCEDHVVNLCMYNPFITSHENKLLFPVPAVRIWQSPHVNHRIELICLKSCALLCVCVPLCVFNCMHYEKGFFMQSNQTIRH
jgi:hypothetical protein